MSKFTLLALFCISLGARASVLFEPYGGVGSGTLGVETTEYADSGAINGLMYGGRVGLLWQHFLIVAGEYQALSGKEKLGSKSSTVDWDQNTTFATLGFQAPMGFRMMGSYAPTSTVNAGGMSYKGSAYKLTLGWCLLSEVAINADYTIYNFTDYGLNGTHGKISDTYKKFSYSAAMVSLSFPLTFMHFGGGSQHKSGGDGDSEAPNTTRMNTY